VASRTAPDATGSSHLGVFMSISVQAALLRIRAV
jgi:hypothetical protein